MSDHALAIWGFIVGLGGVLIGIITAYYFYLKARIRIDPRYAIRHEPLVDSSSGAMADVSVLFKGNKVTNLNKCSLVIMNRGTQAIARDSIAESDKVRVCFPNGAKAVGAGVAWTSRPAIDLSASIQDEGSAVIVNFSFLDIDDGGIIEILYQGNPKQEPVLAGSIIGAPKGFQRWPGTLFVDQEMLENGPAEDEPSSVAKWLAVAAVLCIASVASAIKAGPISPLSIALYIITGEVFIVILLFGVMAIYARRQFGSLSARDRFPISIFFGKPPPR